MSTPELIVTNFNRNFTGVSATAASVVRGQVERYGLHLVGAPLPGCPSPISMQAARALCKGAPRPVIWHVRRNPEMRAALWARDVMRLPIRIVFTSAAQRRHSAYPRWLISRMDAVIATTQAAADFVPHVRAVVPHGVDIGTFTPATDLAQAWTALGYGGTRGIASVGRIRPEKGSDVFVDALITALPQIPDVTALLIGKVAPKDKAFADALKAKIAEAGLTNRIVFVGEMPPDALAKLMPALSLLVAVPRYEGYGMTPLEAMACAVPFVASDTGFFRTFSDGGKAGDVVALEDAAATAQALIGLLTDAPRLAAMSAHALTHARNHHSVAQEIAGIDQVYQSIWANAA